MRVKDRWNAFVSAEIPDTADLYRKRDGLLRGLRLAVKDVYDMKGYVTGAGNPDWRRTHGAASSHAPTITALLEQGAELVGATHTDELMFGLNGENGHYGTPVNPKAPGRIPGGSSSGSAVAVASGMADVALGTDTAGSVRVPASYCGVYGMRPTYGRITMQGIVPLAPAVDTAGWMADSLSTLAKTANALMPDGGQEHAKAAPIQTVKRLIWPSDMWALLDREVKSSAGAVLDKLRGMASFVHEEAVLAEEGLDVWLQAFRSIQGYDIWRTHGKWIERDRPAFAPDVEARFRWSSTIREEDAREALKLKKAVEARMGEWLGTDTLVVIPTTPGVAPPIGQQGEEAEQRRNRALQLCCPAGLAGLPQITVPWLEHEGMPAGLSFIAGPGLDLSLLHSVELIARTIGEPLESGQSLDKRGEWPT
ncbi:amidase [Paenibacillus soyae]|uniref:Amidase n=1 Tax=Paenibacillus soyae TaxID=2969249 RepID=A0A9X2SBI7_9BACL|nr:amidase [Paenibacillus soyae]MCR2805688.1 amidase [Paenibacillus soyae]